MQDELKQELEKHYYMELSTTKGLEEVSRKISISKNTLRRFLGKMKSENKISSASLNLISNFLKYRDFEDFKSQQKAIEVSVLDEGIITFYDFVKNRSIDMNEKVFQNINILNSSKIINNPRKLKLFFLNYKNQNDVLEYVLGWNPSFHRIAAGDYQEILLSYANQTKISHVGVFAHSNIILGKFFSNHLDFGDNLKKAEKSYQKMLEEYDNEFIFPIARFAVAKLYCLYHHEDSKIDDFVTEQMDLPNKRSFDSFQTIIFKVHFADALNFVGKYKEAELLLKDYDENNFHKYWIKYYPEKYKYLFSVCKSMTLLGLGKIDEAKKYFSCLEIYAESKNLTFDIVSYIKLQYSTLGFFLDEQKSAEYYQNIQLLITEMGFHKWNILLKRF